MIDPITLGTAKRYADNICCESTKTLRIKEGDDVIVSDLTMDSIIGSRITADYEYYQIKTPTRKPTGETIAEISMKNNHDNWFCKIMFNDVGGSFSDNVMFFEPSSVNVIVSMCPSFLELYTDYDTIAYAFDQITDTMGLGLIFEPGWYAVKSETFAHTKLDIEKNPIIIVTKEFDTELSENFFDMAEKHDSISFLLEKRDIYEFYGANIVMPASVFNVPSNSVIVEKFGDEAGSTIFMLGSFFGMFLMKSSDEGIKIYNVMNNCVIEYNVLKQIDQKFLPPVDSLIMNSSTEGSEKKFRLTVDDTGTITATEVT